MKILVVSTSFPLTPGDSLSPFIWEYCVGLRNLGWEVTVVVPHHKGTPLNENWEGIDINRFKYLPEFLETLAYSGGLFPKVKKNPVIAFMLPFFIYSMYRGALGAIRKERFDIVNIQWLIPGCFWARRLFRKTGSRIVFTGHGTDIQISGKFPFNRFVKSALGSAAGLTVNSNYMKGLLEGFPMPKKSAIIPMGVDTGRFCPGGAGPADSNKILFIGRLIKQKGVDILLRAFDSLKMAFPKAELEIIGYGPEKEPLFVEIERLNLGGKVIFSDPVPHEKLPDKYREARLLAMPSTIGEGFGITVAEAAACGVPTVTFGMGGTAELVLDGETGVITKPDAESLAEGMGRLFADDNLTSKLGESARQRIADNYGWENISGRFDNFLKSIVNSK